MELRNPFQFGRELGTDELVDRVEEMQLVRRTIENRGKLFLIGPRRYGKTSILKAVEDDLTRQGAVILRFDAEAYESLDRLAEAILTEATHRSAGALERAGNILHKFFGALRPELSMSPDQTISVSIGLSGPARQELPTLIQVLDGVEKMAGETESPVALIIDEFQHVVAADLTAERQFRACIQRHRHVAYVLAGSETHVLAEITGSPDRPFYKLGSRFFLGPVPRDQFLDFLRFSFTESGFSMEEAALEAILDRAMEVPYNVQQLAHHCWEKLRVSEARNLTLDLVDEALEWIVRSNDPFYTKLWSRLPKQQKRAVRALIGENGTELFSSSVSRRYDIPTATMQSSLGKLINDGVVREEQERGKTRYRLEDPFLASWLEFAQ